MRSSHLATLAALTAAGLTAAAALHLRAGRRPTAVTPTAEAILAVSPLQAADGVVLPFVRPAAPAPAQPAASARCGESGGRTKAGTPCASRVTTAGRCHHHPMAA